MKSHKPSEHRAQVLAIRALRPEATLREISSLTGLSRQGVANILNASPELITKPVTSPTNALLSSLAAEVYELRGRVDSQQTSINRLEGMYEIVIRKMKDEKRTITAASSTASAGVSQVVTTIQGGGDGKIAYSPQECAVSLGLSVSTIYSLLKSGELPCTRTDRRILIAKADIKDFLNHGVSRKDARNGCHKDCEQDEGQRDVQEVEQPEHD